jgi:membrane peptidoglycan carboxypeptidase
MSQPSFDQQPAGDDPHQHPGFLEVQRKMRKLVIWSGLIMLIGIAAIIGVIVYKSMGNKKSVSSAPIAQSGPVTQVLQSGERVISMSSDNGYVYVLVEGKGVQSVLQLDGESMAVIKRVQFIPQAQ